MGIQRRDIVFQMPKKSKRTSTKIIEMKIIKGLVLMIIFICAGLLIPWVATEKDTWIKRVIEWTIN